MAWCLRGPSVVVLLTALTVWPSCVVTAPLTVPTMACAPIELPVKRALLRVPTAVAGQTLVGILGGASGPRTVLEEGQTTLAVHSCGVVLTAASQLTSRIGFAFTGVTIAFAPATHREVRHSVVVRLEHSGVLEDVIPKRVEPI